MWNTIGLLTLAALLTWHLVHSGARIIELLRDHTWHLDRGEFFSAFFTRERLEWRVALFIIELTVVANLVSSALGYGWIIWRH